MSLLNKINELKEDINKLVEENVKLTEDCKVLENENNTLNEKYEELNNEMKEIIEENILLYEENVDLMENCKVLENENETLKNEKKMIEEIIKEIEMILGNVMPLVQADGVGYNTLEEAIESVSEGGTVKLNDDIVISETVKINKKMTLDLNGKEIRNEEDIFDVEKKDWSLVSVREGGELTITGEGKMVAKENDCYAIDLVGGNCVIENGEFVGNVTTVYAHTGNLEVNNGRFDMKQEWDGVAFDKRRFMLNCLDKNHRDGVASISVNGGCFVGFNPQNNLSEGKDTNYVNHNYKVIEVEPGVYQVISNINE